MYRQNKNHENRIARYFRKTWVNKLCAITLLSLTLAIAKITGEATAFVIMLVFATPMFFARSNWFTS